MHIYRTKSTLLDIHKFGTLNNEKWYNRSKKKSIKLNSDNNWVCVYIFYIKIYDVQFTNTIKVWSYKHCARSDKYPDKRCFIYFFGKEMIQINISFSCILLINNKNGESTMYISDKYLIHFKNKNFLIWNRWRTYPDECVSFMQYFAK